MRKKISGVLLTLLLFSCSNDTYKGPRSDHFNGETFFNLWYYQQHTFLSILKWYITPKPLWPTHVTTRTYPFPIALNAKQSLQATYVGHASVFVQMQNFNFITDPNWSDRIGPFSWLRLNRVLLPGVPIDKLISLDAVLISHNHFDHLDLPTLKKLNDLYHPVFIVPLGLKKLLLAQKIERITELDWWQQTKIKEAVITSLPAQHWSRRALNDRNKSLWASYGIAVQASKVYFAGDSGYSPHFKDIAKKWGYPTLALLPIGAYEPRWFMRFNHLNPEEAVLAYADLHATTAMAIHFDVWQLGHEKYKQPLQDLNKALVAHTISSAQFLVLNPGDMRAW